MYVYKITCLVNGKIYIGQSKCYKARFKAHIRAAINCTESAPRSHLGNAIRKYGVENFRVEKLCTASSVEEMAELEIYYIKKFKSYKRAIGYNLSMGGYSPGNATFAQKRLWKNRGICDAGTRRKMSRSKKGYIPVPAIAAREAKMETMSDDERRKYCTHFRKFGKDNPQFGHGHTDEVRRRISEAHKGIACRGYGWHHP